MQVAGLDAGLSARSIRIGGIAAFFGRHRRLILGSAILAAMLIAFLGIRMLLREVRPHDIGRALRDIGPARAGLAAMLTAGSYFALTLYDWLALRVIGRPLPWRTAALASFTSYTLSHNLGFSLATGGSARLRAYTAAGLGFADVARITLIASATFWSGVLAIAAVALLTAAAPIAVGPVTLGVPDQQLIGVVLVVLILCPFVLRWGGTRRLKLGSATMPLPGPFIMAAQVGVAVIDLACACGALFVLIPDAPAALFGAFFLAYSAATILTLVTHVPGGVGVFEATVLALAPVDRSAVFAALLLYRIIYYLLPLAAAGFMLAVIEGERLRRPLTRAVSLAEAIGQALAPTIAAALVFMGGLVLLVSGALPGLSGRVLALASLLPLPFVEASHFAASLAGSALLLIAPAVQARLRSGFHAARAVLLAGAAFSLLKGFDYEEAAILLAVAAILQYGQGSFYRRAGIGAAPIARWWWAAALIGVAISIWAGFFAYRHVPYSSDLWWEFAWQGNAPRFLRATLGVAAALCGFALWRLLAAPATESRDCGLPATVAARALAATGRSDAMLAFTGDKDFLVSAGGDAFLMYRVVGRSWIVMGDPVGPPDAWPELLWEIRRRCDAAHGRLCIYHVGAAMLPLLIDLGLQPMKCGEEAVVDLSQRLDFSGSRFRSLRHAVRKATAAGLSLAIVPAAEVPALIDELRAVSDRWLAAKPGGEKGFSVGRFDPAYLSRFDCAVVRQGRTVIAFANLWATPNGEELSIDLMRHLPEAPYGTMDFLLFRLLQYGADLGFVRFNLGLAPLSGLKADALAPAWSRIGAAIYAHGERLYGFSGLRAFKAKFAPRWSPLYLAVTPGLSVPRALVDLAALIGK